MPLTSLLRGKPKLLSWDSKAHEAVEKLKEAFSTAPILRHPDLQGPFVVEVDASTTGVGAVLSQQSGEPPSLHPCAYFSKKLSPAEVNYDIGNRELLAIKLALEEWRHWLEGAQHPFIVITNHKNLQYLREAKRLNPRQARWALFFTRFNFTITYRPGNRNCKTPYQAYTPQNLPRNQKPSSLQPSSSVPFSGTSLRTSVLPLSLNPLRWEVQKGKPMSQHPNANPFWSQCTKFRALDTQAADGPSHSFKLSTGGPVWPGMSSGTSAAAQSVPCRRRPGRQAHAIARSTTALVPYRNWFCDGSPQLRRQYLCPGSRGSLLKGMQVHPSQGTPHSLRNCRMPV